MLLTPCAMLFFPDGDLDATGTVRRIVVLEAPQGALLQFDQPIDLQRGKIGQLLGGDMKGPITINGTPSRAAAHDDLHVETRDVQMNTQRIWTKAPVEFTFGDSAGSGRESRDATVFNDSRSSTLATCPAVGA